MAAELPPLVNLRHAAFVRAYVRTLSPSAAAVEAGYGEKSAGKRAWHLLRRREIREAIAALQAQRLADEGLSAQRVLEELRRLAFADVRSLYRDDGTLKDIQEWTAEHGAAVQEVTLQLGPMGSKVMKVRLWDKAKSLELLCKHFQLTADRTEVSGGITISWLPPEGAAPQAVEGEIVPMNGVKRLPPAKDPA
jgi:phage terminase small subunit